MALYAKVDEWTYGNAKHIALLIGGLLLYIVAMVIFYVTRASFKYIYLAFALLYRALYGNGATDVSINGGTIPDSVGVAVDDVSSSTPNVGSGGDEFEF